MHIAATGFLTGLSLIVAIGAQNAFVLRLGLMRSHVGIAVFICALSDAILISSRYSWNGRARFVT
jgi:L-lysine exporter family protein LysE/ArgO